MMWYEQFPIGDGNRTTEDEAPPVYRGYRSQCEIDLTEELFNEIKAQGYAIFQTSKMLKDIQFTPEVTPKQATSKYYFLKFEAKIPRPN